VLPYFAVAIASALAIAALVAAVTIPKRRALRALLAAPLARAPADGKPFDVPDADFRQLWLDVELLGPEGFAISVEFKIGEQTERITLSANADDAISSSSSTLGLYSGLASQDRKWARPSRKQRRLTGTFLIAKVTSDATTMRVDATPIRDARIARAEAIVIAKR
jgi:hypothetical protein